MAKAKEQATTEDTEAKATGTAVGAAKNTSVANYDYGEDEGLGFEKPAADELSIPFLAVLQAMSPQVDPETGVDGAVQGMIYNTVTEELFKGKEGINFIPAYKTHLYVEWVPREKGGGIVGFHDIDSAVVATAKAEAKAKNSKFGQLQSAAGNDLIETYYLYGLVNGESMAVISFSSTKIKVLRQWFTKIYTFQLKQADGRKVKPPLFAHQVRITTEKQTSDKGDYYNFVMKAETGNVESSLLPPNDPRFQEAKNICDMVKGGVAKAAFETQEKAGGGTAAPGGSADGEDDVPF